MFGVIFITLNLPSGAFTFFSAFIITLSFIPKLKQVEILSKMLYTLNSPTKGHSTLKTLSKALTTNFEQVKLFSISKANTSAGLFKP